METDLIPNVRGNVQNLRNIWSTKGKEEQNLLKPKPVTYRSQSQTITTTTKQPIKIQIQSPASVDEIILSQKSMVTFDNAEPMIFQPIEQTLSIDDIEDSTPLPPPPSSIIFKQQAQSIAILKQTVSKMLDTEKKKSSFPDEKTNGIRHWHIARHVFRSGLIFGPTRRASDSIIPLLMKTHIAQYRSRRDSLDSNQIETPFENLIDYIAHNHYDNKQLNIPNEKQFIKRTISDTSNCIQRNKLEDTITQYESIMRRLKNYEKFMAAHPQSSSPMQTLIDIQENEINSSIHKSSTRIRQTQSLARSAGRTFTEFVMNDLLPSQSNEPRRLSTVHAASQTDLNELIKKLDSIPIEDTKAVLNELDTAINDIVQQQQQQQQPPPPSPITPNSEVNVIIVNPPVIPEVKPEVTSKNKPLMQRLFEGKKTSYTSNDLQMESNRIPEDLAETFAIAKEKCFFPEEEIVYASKMIKIDRRGYKQHVRILCLTSERLYIITKKKPYPKEALLFKDILGISCTPRRDGFVCLHTRETRDDRGDWIFIVDHPCEFITQLFMAMGKTNNNDHYLKIKAKFQHTRRNIATVTDECVIEARPSDTFHIVYENYETLVINTP